MEKVNWIKPDATGNAVCVKTYVTTGKDEMGRDIRERQSRAYPVRESEGFEVKRAHGKPESYESLGAARAALRAAPAGATLSYHVAIPAKERQEVLARIAQFVFHMK